jgi:hypothetical protein
VSRIKVDALQGTSGSDTAITLSGANATVGGTLAVTGVHTVGNNAIYTSEGGAVTQNAVQSLAKHWAYFSMAGTSFSDSFNSSSLTDSSTGQFYLDTTSAFSSTNYAIQFSSNCHAGDTWNINQAVNAKQNWLVTNTTSRYDLAVYADGAYVDAKYNYTLGHGDLA